MLRSGLDGGCTSAAYYQRRAALGEIRARRSGNTCEVTSLLVKPAGPLTGVVQAFGAKNAVLKQMAACLLASGRHQLTNVPAITDVDVMCQLLESLGCAVERPAAHELAITVPDAADLHPVAPASLFEAMRASIVVLGPLLARCGEANMALPGGDDFGQRPINFHTEGLSAMGATFHNDRTSIRAATSRPRLRATRITLEYPSHTATDNLMMACVLADGRSVIDNAAREPEVEDLGRQLIAMGARIEGLGTSRLTIDGVASLSPTRHEVVADRVVSATYLAGAMITAGDVRVLDARAEHMEMLLRKIEEVGGTIDERGPGIRVVGPARPRAGDVATLPYPGVATDYKPFITTMLSVADGVSVVTENLFAGRFRYVDELTRLGARITTTGHHAVIRGVDHLVGTTVRATDIRAAAALVLAGLVAEGETTVTGAEHVDRGYDDFVGRLTSLGARLERGE
jgi:UDP-N-acetylglucosamine 1-carboxyvinyltransferase